MTCVKGINSIYSVKAHLMAKLSKHTNFEDLKQVSNNLPEKTRVQDDVLYEYEAFLTLLRNQFVNENKKEIKVRGKKPN